MKQVRDKEKISSLGGRKDPFRQRERKSWKQSTHSIAFGLLLLQQAETSRKYLKIILASFALLGYTETRESKPMSRRYQYEQFEALHFRSI
jgi:hypothetical protein